jgi:hypothetical protein
MLPAIHSVVIPAHISENLSLQTKAQFGITRGKYQVKCKGSHS